jgi:hypothetical protein
MYGTAEKVASAVLAVPETWSDSEKLLGEWLIDDRVFEKRNRLLLFSEEFESVGFGAREIDGAVYVSLVFGKGFKGVERDKPKPSDGWVGLVGVGMVWLSFLLF